MWVWTLASLTGLRIRHCVSCGVGHRHGSVLTLLWLWCKLAAAALIRTPSLRTSIYLRCSHKKRKKERKKESKQASRQASKPRGFQRGDGGMKRTGIRMTSDFWSSIMETRNKHWNHAFKILQENDFLTRNLCPAELSTNYEDRTLAFPNMLGFKNFTPQVLLLWKWPENAFQ